MSIVQSQKRFKVGDTAYYYDYKNDKPAKLIVLEVTKFGYRKVKLENGEIEPWFNEMLTLDELYNRHKQIFTDNYESAKNLCLAWWKNLRELNSFYKKEKEMNKKEVCKLCDHFRPDENFCAFTNRKLTEWEINNDSGICFYPKEQEK